MFEYVKDPHLKPVRPYVLKNYTDIIMIHHEAAPSDGDQDDDDVTAIHKNHISRGYKGIGYGYVVDDGGVIWLGRGPDYASGGTKDRLGYNSHVVDICFVGNYSEGKLPESMEEAGKRLVRDLIKYFEAKGQPIKKILGHKDVDNTQCPGNFFPLKEFKSLLNESNDTPSVQNKPTASSNSFTISKLLKLDSPYMSGKDVTTVQDALQNEGYNLKADGIFGPKTENAVKEFQSREGLVVDGMVGKNTVNALGGKYKNKSSNTSSSKILFTIGRQIEFRIPMMAGNDIKNIQKRLIALKYSVGTTGVDGVYGVDTERAVKNFQEDKNLKVDGIVGKNTAKALGGRLK